MQMVFYRFISRTTRCMGRKGDCRDNAVTESFFGTLKTELVHRADYTTRDQAQRDIVDYIEGALKN